MGIYSYEEAFGCWDMTTEKMRNAIRLWFELYYGSPDGGGDPCQRIAYTVVNKLVRTVFGEYTANSSEAFGQRIIEALARQQRLAMELCLVGGECYIKPCFDGEALSFGIIARNNVLVFGRNADGTLTDIGTVERCTQGNAYYTLLERRTVDKDGYLTIRNKLFRSMNGQQLGVPVSLQEIPKYRKLMARYRFEEPVGSVGLVQLRTPMLNCVDGSQEAVSVYAAAAGLIRCIDENEMQLRGEFRRGQSRVFASRDLLRPDGRGGMELSDELFVGLDESPEQVGLTIFAPQLRQKSYLERKWEYLRNVESVIGLKRGMLSDADAQDRTATEISASAADYNLTVIDFQRVWETAVRQTVDLCCTLARLYRLGQFTPGAVNIDWGNGVLYDEDKVWAGYLEMVDKGLMKPEIAMGWRFGMPTRTEAERRAVRQSLMP